MSRSLIVGEWIEPVAREVTVHRTYYAADYEVLRIRPGRYPVRITLEGGYTIPMPYWLLVGVDADRIDGAFYNGFGGVNYSATPAPPGPDTWGVQMYAYQLADLEMAGRVVVFEPHRWLLGTREAWPQTWDDDRLKEAVRL